MLKNQYKRCQIVKTPCCQNGSVHTEELKKEYEELQNPPEGFIENLVGAEDPQLRERFLKNTYALNNTFAFASTSSTQIDESQMNGRKDLCKYNGKNAHPFFS
jgi:hypothetical protein